MLVEKYQKTRVQAMLDMRKRKDWVNSALFQNVVRLEQESPLDTIESINSIGNHAVTAEQCVKDKDKTSYSASEAEYLSKLFCQQLSMQAMGETVETEGNKTAAEEEDEEPDVWNKALKTESMLRDELALYKRLPKEV